MKPIRSIFTKSGLRAALLSAVVALTAGPALAQNVVLSFGTNSLFAAYATNETVSSATTGLTNGLGATSWHWWGSATSERTYDKTNDASGNPQSGSIKISIQWPAGGGDQYSVALALSGVNNNYDNSVSLPALNYTNMEMDIMWDPASTMNITNHMTGGDPTGLGFGFVATQYGQSWVPNANQPVLINDGQWHHYVIPINSGWPNIPGLIFKKYKNGAAEDANTTSKFWIDNVTFNFNTNIVIPKPAMTIAKASKGLNITAAQAAAQYQRESVRSIPADAIEWYGNVAPVTYSWTIGEFPARAVAPGYFSTLFLAPNGAGGMTPDWDDANVIVVETTLNAANQGICSFRMKTNAPAGNGVLYGVGSLAQLVDPSGVLGAWSVTFTNDSFITIVGPSGVSTNFDMGAAAAAFFDVTGGSLPTYFGFQPGGPANIGFRGVYSRLKVQNGATTVVDDTFPVNIPPDGTDALLWIPRYQAGAVAGQVVDHPGAYWLDWNKPDSFLSNFQLSSNVLTGWVDPGLDIRDHGARRAVFTDTNTLVNYPDAAYFRLMGTNF
jgi:hypothetical protein